MSIKAKIEELLYELEESYSVDDVEYHTFCKLKDIIDEILIELEEQE